LDDRIETIQLRDWVAWQRREVQVVWKQEVSHVTSEHVKRLSDIGFEWQSGGAITFECSENYKDINKEITATGTLLEMLLMATVVVVVVVVMVVAKASIFYILKLLGL
jgi:hypothetical protein